MNIVLTTSFSVDFRFIFATQFVVLFNPCVSQMLTNIFFLYSFLFFLFPPLFMPPELCGGVVAGCCCLVELPKLGGRKKLEKYPVISVIDFDCE